MPFEIRVNGAVVSTFAEQVTGVHMRTARGEAAALGISDVGAVDIIVDVVNINDPLRLDVLEARRIQERRDYMDANEGGATGPSAQTSDPSLAVKQDILEARYEVSVNPEPVDPPAGDEEFSVS